MGWREPPAIKLFVQIRTLDFGFRATGVSSIVDAWCTGMRKRFSVAKDIILITVWVPNEQGVGVYGMNLPAPTSYKSNSE